ncbi:branched-chain amino acid ABC transporter permease [Bosea sp. BK604]|uniref:branched-chain amino acid ABC transporter permease n=1 Tax=Bosea sp. BK604 TaxID=2512180 RepID=UPI001053D3DB|nr:branched-chain amino acid ABC transporter permease [Bosea sp. BK604]TCR62535.1 amino acid/amide ABC transporter membrane protein 1 (HAAT family) [Bosea sp. BK604]
MDLFAQLLVNGLGNGSRYALLGLGFGLIFGTTRIVHFAYGPIYAVAAYAAWLAASAAGLPLAISAAIGVAGAALAGAAVYGLAYRPFEARGMSSHSVLILSLALSIVLDSLLTLAFTPSVQTIPEFTAPIFILGPVYVTALQLGQIAAVVAVAAILTLFLRRTRYGQAILALGDNRDMARIVGIDTDRISLVVFAIGSAVSAIAAVFTLLNEGATPTMGFNPVFIAFVVAVVGGLGSIPGAIAGGYLVGLVESLGLWKIPTEWQNSIAFVLLFLVMLVRPQGLFSGLKR